MPFWLLRRSEFRQGSRSGSSFYLVTFWYFTLTTESLCCETEPCSLLVSILFLFVTLICSCLFFCSFALVCSLAYFLFLVFFLSLLPTFLSFLPSLFFFFPPPPSAFLSSSNLPPFLLHSCLHQKKINSVSLWGDMHF